jgi:hypothetical protein
MTAEVCVLNRLGVALAADSAISIGVDAKKIFTSSDKLFQLSRTAPVGIMIYGNAVIADTPWETVIKESRRRLGERTFNLLTDYANDFLKFISRDTRVLSVGDRDDTALNLVRQLYLHVREEIRRSIDKAAQTSGLKQTDLPRIIARPVRARLDVVKQEPRVKGITAQERALLRRRMAGQVRRLEKTLFGRLPMDAATRRALRDLAFEMLTRRYLSPQKSGLVFAGFGRTDFRPRLVSYEVDGMVRNRMRYVERNNVRIGADTYASVVPFAQQEMVHTFMQGINESFRVVIHQSTRNVVKGAVDLVLEAVLKKDPQIAKAVRRRSVIGMEKMLDRLFKDWQDRCENHWGPVVDIVSTLPKDELAAMAEALVNLTKFRRKVTPASETVGGPIDVAVVTKGDGFVWVRRKHYFDPDLNPRVMSRIRGESAA